MSTDTMAEGRAFQLRDQWLHAGTGASARVADIRQGWGTLQQGRAIAGEPICLNGRRFAHGLGAHANSEVLVAAVCPITRFAAWVGVDDNAGTRAHSRSRIVFAVHAGGQRLWQSAPLGVGDAPVEVSLALQPGVHALTLTADAGAGDINYAHADWVGASLSLADGTVVALGQPRDPGAVEGPLFSLRLDGRPAWHDWQGWTRETAPAAQLPGAERTAVTWRHRTHGLRCRLELTEFRDFPALDWVLEITNEAKTESPLLEDILPLDVASGIGPQDPLRLLFANGSLCRMDDFLPQEIELAPGVEKTLAPMGGRSSNGVLPFMNLHHSGGGLVLGIGWSGQWAASFRRSTGEVRMTAGMEGNHLRLRPGESIRTPRILALFWDGDDAEAGQNQLRQFLLAHVLPRLDGKPVMPPVAQCLQGYYYATGQAGEKLEMAALPKAVELGVEAYWIDACWYGRTGRQWWEEVGSWVVNREKFPRGLKPIADAAHQAGMQFILWFEPERVRRGSVIEQEHPEFLLHNAADPDNLLLDLGLPEARRHITELVSAHIAEIGIDVYRQDFNFDPLPYWRAADAPERQGMSEIRHIEGLYAFWDELRRRHPRLWIDNCSSGGRRIDLELLARSLPLWPSDFMDVPGLGFGMGLHLGDQCVNAGLARWVPFFGGGLWNFTPYGVRGEICGGFTFGMHLAREDYADAEGRPVGGSMDVLKRGLPLWDPRFPMDDARAAIAEWRSLRPFFSGDFHLLLPLSVAAHEWCAFQYHRPDLEAGFALYFRRHRSPFTAMQAALKRILPEAAYEVSVSAGFEEAPRQRLSGRELVSLALTIAECPGSLLLRYTRVAQAGK